MPRPDPFFLTIHVQDLSSCILPLLPRQPYALPDTFILFVFFVFFFKFHHVHRPLVVFNIASTLLHLPPFDEACEYSKYILTSNLMR